MGELKDDRVNNTVLSVDVPVHTGRIVAYVEVERVVERVIVAGAILEHAHCNVGPRALFSRKRRRRSARGSIVRGAEAE